MEGKVTVIVPIYNALDDLKKCIDSVIRHTDFSRVDVLLIDDHSPDHRIEEYLKTLPKEQFQIHHNEKNYGFSHNVNYGFQHSSGDVILLNTDTIVTKGWVEKLERCAYSDPYIGTVTPFSNSATICSIPVFCQDNRLPEGFTVDSYAELVEKCSMHQYPEIPVAVGFCMYIKRTVIDATGLFDEETFGKGYGEENDFCNRVQIQGYYHVLCDDTFIFHSGTASFVPDQKKKLMSQHEKIIQTKYPRMNAEVQKFAQTNPLFVLQENVNIHALLHNGRRNILFILHRDFAEDAADHVGGTQLHVRDLKDALKNKYNLFVLARDGEYLRLTIYSESHEKLLRYHVGLPKARPTFHDQSIAKVYQKVLDTFPIDIVHVQHVFDMSNDIFSIAADRGIPVYMTIHDLYLICPSLKLLDDSGKLCLGEDNAQRCTRCVTNGKWFSESVPDGGEYIRNWRKESRRILSRCRRIFTPSESAKNMIGMYFPEVKNKIDVIEHAVCSDVYEAASENVLYGLKNYFEIIQMNEQMMLIAGWSFIEGKDTKESVPIIEIHNENGGVYRYKSTALRRDDVAAVYGSLYKEAGYSVEIPGYAIHGKTEIFAIRAEKEKKYYSEAHVVQGEVLKLIPGRLNIAFVGGLSVDKGSDIALQMIQKRKKQINWFTIGAIGDRDLAYYRQSNLTHIGPYRREDIVELLQELRIDMICIPAKCPETFCFVLSEAIEAGVPVIAADIGALGERIAKYKCGWTVDPKTGSRGYLAEIDNLISKPEVYAATKNRIEEMRLSTEEDMGNAYSRAYQDVLNDRNPRAVYHPDYDFVREGVLGGSGERAHARVRELERELGEIHSSTGYKALMAFRTLRIPFKPQIKRLIYCVWKKRA